MIRCTGPVAALAAVLCLVGCSSDTAGHGTAASGTPVVTEDPDAGTPTATASTSHGGGNGGGGGSSTGGSHSTKTGTATRTATTDPNARAEILLMQATSGPRCTGTSGSSTVSLAWQTKGGDEVWIQVTPVAVAASDPKTTPGSSGPLPPNGSKTLPFDCGNPNDYYNLGVYNTGNGTHAGQILQVPRN
jgi:hypothetical protein